MSDDNPYQPPAAIEEPDENQALVFDAKTWKEIWLIFFSPTAVAVVLALVTSLLPFPGLIFVVIAPLFALWANWRLSKICAHRYRDAHCEKSIIFGIWFVMWAIAQILLALFTFMMIGTSF